MTDYARAVGGEHRWPVIEISLDEARDLPGGFGTPVYYWRGDDVIHFWPWSVVDVTLEPEHPYVWHDLERLIP